MVLVGTDQRFLSTRDRSATDVLSPIDVFASIYGGVADPIGPDTPRRVFEQSGRFIGIYVQDLVTIVDPVKLLFGGRYDFARLETTSRNTGTGVVTRSEFDDGVFTPRTGLVVQPLPSLALYVSYAKSFNPLLGTTFEGSAFEPERGVQYEGGVKFDSPWRALLGDHRRLPADARERPDVRSQ
jgi:iron complex outermembrane receptor protein